MSQNLVEFLRLTTTGRRSGQPREVELWFAQRNGCYYVIAEYYTANWVQNLRADPRIHFSVKGKNFEGQARVVDAGADAALNRDVQRLFREKYGWSEGLVVELCPGKNAPGGKTGSEKNSRLP